MKHVIRLDLEVDVKDDDEAGEIVNTLIELSDYIVRPKHYQWRFAQLDDGLDDADLEKVMAQAQIDD